jgi:hypothetical protein
MSLVILLFLFLLFWPTPESVETLEIETGVDIRPVINLLGQAGLAATIAITIGGTLMAIVVATLPRRK